MYYRKLYLSALSIYNHLFISFSLRYKSSLRLHNNHANFKKVPSDYLRVSPDQLPFYIKQALLLHWHRKDG